MQLKLFYFNFPFWRAEVPRIALHYAGVSFEDVRLDWAAFCALRDQDTFPYRQVPVLEVDGEVVAQSAAIARFCGRLGGLYPDDALHAAVVDELLDCLSEVNYLITPSVRERDPERRAAMRAELAAHTLPKWLSRIEGRLVSLSPNPWLIGAKMTIADLALWRFGAWLSGGILDGIPNTILDPYPTLRTLGERVAQGDIVQAYERATRVEGT